MPRTLALYPTGRKHCAKCGCWRLLLDFRQDTRSRSVRFRSHCRTCERVATRRRLGIRAKGKPYGVRQLGCRRGHHPKHRRGGICQVCRRERQRSPEYRRYQREYRMFARGGLKHPLPHAPKDPGENTRLSAKPFARWLAELVKHYGWDGAQNRAGLDNRTIRRVFETAERGSFVHIDVVDRALCNEGNTMLWELYPDLYPDLESPPKIKLLPKDESGIIHSVVNVPSPTPAE